MSARTMARCSKGHFLPGGSVPYTLDPDCWDDTCRCTARPRLPRQRPSEPAVAPHSPSRDSSDTEPASKPADGRSCPSQTRPNEENR
jgi:hypothetical protein